MHDEQARPRVDPEMREFNRRLRLAFLEVAEERSRREHGRPLTDEELRRELRRYPGDSPER